MLDMPDWEDHEFDEMDLALKNYIQCQNLNKNRILKRLRILKSGF